MEIKKAEEKILRRMIDRSFFKPLKLVDLIDPRLYRLKKKKGVYTSYEEMLRGQLNRQLGNRNAPKQHSYARVSRMIATVFLDLLMYDMIMNNVEFRMPTPSMTLRVAEKPWEPFMQNIDLPRIHDNVVVFWITGNSVFRKSLRGTILYTLPSGKYDRMLREEVEKGHRYDMAEVRGTLSHTEDVIDLDQIRKMTGDVKTSNVEEYIINNFIYDGV